MAEKPGALKEMFRRDKGDDQPRLRLPWRSKGQPERPITNFQTDSVTPKTEIEQAEHDGALTGASDTIQVLRLHSRTKTTSESNQIPFTGAASNPVPSAVELSPAYRTQPNSQPEDDLWGRALSNLRKENPDLVENLKGIVKSGANLPENLSVKEQLATVVTTMRRTMTDKPWTFRWRGKPQKVQEQVEHIVKIVQTRQGLWLILNDSEQRLAVLGSLEDIAKIIARYGVVEDLYLQRDDITLKKDFESALKELYTSILEFHAKAACDFGRNTLHRLGRNILKFDDWKGLIQKINSLDATCKEFTQMFDSKNQKLGLETVNAMLTEKLEKVQKMLELLVHDAFNDAYNKATDPNSGPGIAILLGIGGAGNTQLALEYCRKAETKGYFNAIFWVDASSPTTLAKSFQSIGDEIFGGKQQYDDTATMIASIRPYMSTWETCWLIVMDNFDRPGVFQNRYMNNYWAQRRAGAVLFTSRDKGSGRLGQIIPVDGMLEDEAVKLLFRSSKKEPDRGNTAAAKRIVELLDCLPLAIDQAGAYINARHGHISLQDFPDHYRKRKERVLKETPEWQWEYPSSHGDPKAQSSLGVFETWEISLECLRGTEAQRKAKVHLLSVSAFFSIKSVSEDIFRAHFEASYPHPEWMDVLMPSGEWNQDDFRDVVSELWNLSLLQSLRKGLDGSEFPLHQLIGEWMTLRMEPPLRKMYAQEATLMLSDAVPPVSTGCPIDRPFELRQRTLSHIDACLQNFEGFMPRNRILGQGLADEAAKRFASFYTQNGWYKKAKNIYESALKTKEGREEMDKLGLLWILRGLSEMYHRQFQQDEFRAMSSKFLLASEKNCAPNDRELLEALNCQGLSYMDQGRAKEAEGCFARALAEARVHLGLANVLTLALLENLASLYFVNRQVIKAEAYANEVIGTYRDSYNLCYPQVWRAQYVLVKIFDLKKEHDKAKDLLCEIETGLIATLGPTHPDTLLVKAALCIMYRMLGKHTEALASCMELFETCRRVLGPGNIKTIESQAELGRIYSASGQQDLAETSLQGSLKICEKLWGRNDWRTVNKVIEPLALVYSRKKEKAKAESLRREIVQMQGSESALCERVRYDALWGLYYRCALTDRLEEAEAFVDQAMTTARKFLETGSLDYPPEEIFKRAQSNYEMLGRAIKADNVSAKLLALWHDKGIARPGPGYVDCEVIAEAVKMPLPTAFTTICDALIYFRWNNGDKRYLALGSALLHVKDEGNAQVAFEQCLDRSAFAQGLPAKCFDCNMCQNPVSGPMFLCMICFNLGLCFACMEKYKGNDPVAEWQPQKGCADHIFLTVPRDKWLDFAVGVVDANGQTLEYWLGQTRKKYRGHIFSWDVEKILAGLEVASAAGCKV